MSSFNEVAALTIPAIVNTTPVGGATLPWNGTSVYYQWSITLNIVQQTQSSTIARAPLEYDGMDVNVGQWIADINAGLAWQIIGITSKNSTTVVCTVQDIFRYNTYRDPTQSGAGDPAPSNYVIFKLAEDGTPVIDPVPETAAPNFYTQLVSRFAYINNQNDFALTQLNNTTVTFNYGDIIAIHEPTQTFVEADSADPTTVIGRVTAVDDTGTVFTINPLGKIVDTFDSLPGQVGSLLYTDPSNAGQLTATPGGTEIYIKLRNATQSTTTSNSLASNSTPVTTAGYTFNVNKVLATVGGFGYASDIVAAINATTSTSGVSAVLTGSGPYFIVSTAVDAREIAFDDVAGSVTTDVGLISVENGVKAAAMSVPSSGAGAPTLTATEVAFGSSTNTLTSSSNLTWNDSTQTLAGPAGLTITTAGGSNVSIISSNLITLDTQDTVFISQSGTQYGGLQPNVNGGIAISSQGLLDLTMSGALEINNQPGTVGQVLTTQGAGQPPTWTTPSITSLTTGYVGYGSSGNTVTGTSDLQFENSDNNSTLTIGDGNPNSSPGIVQGPNGIGIVIKGGHSNGNTTNASLSLTSSSDLSGNSGAGNAYLYGGGAQGTATGGSVYISSGSGPGSNGTVYIQVAGNTLMNFVPAGINVMPDGSTVSLAFNADHSWNIPNGNGVGIAGGVLTSGGIGTTPSWSNNLTWTDSSSTLAISGNGITGLIETTANDPTFGGDPSFVLSSNFGLTLVSNSQELALQSNKIYFSTGSTYGGVSSDSVGGLNIFSNGNFTLSMQGGLIITGSGYSSAGNAGDVLTSQGGSANPRWVTPPTPPAGFSQTYGFVFTQTTPITSWAIAHNGGTENVLVQVYDSTNKVILPDEIEIVDINNITITFAAVQAGKALLTIIV
jgi:hypothetical protein